MKKKNVVSMKQHFCQASQLGWLHLGLGHRSRFDFGSFCSKLYQETEPKTNVINNNKDTTL
jgi:hypothetical protein